MGLFEQRARAESFGAEAERYDRLRPGYPPELVAWLGADGTGSAVDVGCGTGRVARMLLDAGWQVVGVEPDERMAAVARRKGVVVEVGHFEDWTPAGTPFDLVSAGQSWHWVDPDRGCRKAAEVLRPGGRFAAFWNLYRYEPEVAAAIAAAYAREAPELGRDSVVAGTAERLDDPPELGSLRASGRFDDVELRTFAHGRDQPVEEWLDELTTHSPHALLPPRAREQLQRELRRRVAAVCGDVVPVRYETRLVTGVRA